MKQKQSQKVVVNINAPKPKRKRRAKKSAKKPPIKPPIQPPIYSPMPQSVIRYYDNSIPQRNMEIRPPPAEVPKILKGIEQETEYAKPIVAERKPIEVPTPLPETEHVLLRNEELVEVGGREPQTALDIIEDRPEEPLEPAPEEPLEPAPIEKSKLKKKKKIESQPTITDFFPPTPVEPPPLEPFPLPPKSTPVLGSLPPIIRPLPPILPPLPEPPLPETNDLEKGAEERKPRKVRQSYPEWFKAYKKDFDKANKEERQYQIEELEYSPEEAKRAYELRKRQFIDSVGKDTSGFSYAYTPPVQISGGGGISFV